MEAGIDLLPCTAPRLSEEIGPSTGRNQAKNLSIELKQPYAQISTNLKSDIKRYRAASHREIDVAVS